MAVTLIRNRSHFQCTSADTKPLGAAVGDILFESDTASDWEFNGTAWVKKSTGAIDSSTNARETIEYEHHEIHSGSHYHVQGFLDIPGANDVLDFTWQMPNTTKWIHWTWSIDTEKALTWYVYRDVVASNALANVMPMYNSNHNSTNTSATVMRYEIQVDLAAANADTNVSGGVLVGSGKLGDNKAGGSAQRQHETILAQGELYCLRALASSAGYVNFDMHWYEHTNK